MFQSGKQRTQADEKHICVTCLHNHNCLFKPTNYGWRFVLTFCQKEVKLQLLNK